jgi:hypothetical protein
LNHTSESVALESLNVSLKKNFSHIRIFESREAFVQSLEHLSTNDFLSIFYFSFEEGSFDWIALILNYAYRYVTNSRSSSTVMLKLNEIFNGVNVLVNDFHRGRQICWY